MEIVGVNKAGKKVKWNGPASWAELTAGMFETIVREWNREDEIQLFCMMYGADYDIVANANSEEVLTTVLRVTSFFHNVPPDFHTPKSVIAFKGRNYSVPENPNKLTVAQMIKLRHLLIKDKEKFAANICEAVAIYLQPVIDRRSFDYERVKEIANELRALPVLRVYPSGFFFLTKCLNYGIQSASVWNLVKMFGVRKTINLLLERELAVWSNSKMAI